MLKAGKADHRDLKPFNQVPWTSTTPALFAPNSLTLLLPNNVGRERAGSRDAGRLSGGLGLCSWDPADQLLPSRGQEGAAANTRLLKRVVKA